MLDLCEYLASQLWAVLQFIKALATVYMTLWTLTFHGGLFKILLQLLNITELSKGLRHLQMICKLITNQINRVLNFLFKFCKEVYIFTQESFIFLVKADWFLQNHIFIRDSFTVGIECKILLVSLERWRMHSFFFTATCHVCCTWPQSSSDHAANIVDLLGGLLRHLHSLSKVCLVIWYLLESMASISQDGAQSYVQSILVDILIGCGLHTFELMILPCQEWIQIFTSA